MCHWFILYTIEYWVSGTDKDTLWSIAKWTSSCFIDLCGILSSIEYYGHFWGKDTYFSGTLMRKMGSCIVTEWTRLPFLLIFFRGKERHTEEKARGIKTEKKYILRSGHDGEQCGNVHRAARQHHRLMHFFKSDFSYFCKRDT